MKPIRWRLALGVAVAASAVATGCANLPRSRDLADARVAADVTAQQVCSNCHGIDGVSITPNVPRLAGQTPEYVSAQLRNFRERRRSDRPGYQYMWGLVRHLSDAQIDGLAAYFAAQTPRANLPVEPRLAARGQKIFSEGLPDRGTQPCRECHGPAAAGAAVFPRLAGQHQAYLEQQLAVFKSANGRAGTPMEAVARAMTADEMRAVAGYLQGLRPTE